MSVHEDDLPKYKKLDCDTSPNTDTIHSYKSRFSPPVVFTLIVTALVFVISLGLFSVITVVQYTNCTNITLQAHTQFTKSDPNATCNVPDPSKVDCGHLGTQKSDCEAKGCCWVPVDPNPGNVAWCFYKSSPNAGYSLDGAKPTAFGYTGTLSRKDKTHWPDDVMELQLDIYEETSSRLHFKIYDPNNQRYEVPVETPKVMTKASSTDYKVTLQHKPFGVKITRQGTAGTVLFDSSVMPMTYANQYIQLGTSLPTKYIYGLGEHRGPLLHDASKGGKHGFWARDQPPGEHINLYGSHPFYLGIETNGQAFGVFILNSNAMEINILPGSPPKLIYTIVGGILDFYIFTGPTPNDVIAQYTAVIGRPFLPPYWGLGFHLCRWGFPGGTTGLKTVIHRMRQLNMPYDTQWNDIDYMDKHLDWTYDKTAFAGLPDVVKDLHDNGQHYIMIVDPGIKNQAGYAPYDDGLKSGIFVMKSDGSGPIIGTVWPGNTAYPDFTNPKSIAYWSQMAKSYHDEVPFDGIWCDMNEPSDFTKGSISGCLKNKWNDPPYTPGIGGGDLKDKTLCPDAKQSASIHYDVHNLYGHTEAIASNKALVSIRNKRSFVITRSTFPSSGRWAGHWLGDNNADPQNMKYSVAGILNFNFFGIPLVGADICGFMGNTEEALCTRWMQLGAFYPFMRNHNTKGAKDQDPANPDWSNSTHNAIRDVLNVRYTLLPFLYTLLYQSHVHGMGVARPLFFQYPTDVNTYSIDTQFMWSDALLISPVLMNPSATSVKAYIPKDTWYDFYTGAMVQGTGAMTTLDAPMDKINVHIRGGSIIPTQQPAVTTTLSRKNDFGLLVALSSNGIANGSLYWDDGDTINTTESGAYNLIKFGAASKSVEITVPKSGYKTTMTLGTATIMGVATKPTSVTINSKAATFTYDAINKVLKVTSLATSLMQASKLSWT